MAILIRPATSQEAAQWDLGKAIYYSLHDKCHHLLSLVNVKKWWYQKCAVFKRIWLKI